MAGLDEAKNTREIGEGRQGYLERTGSLHGGAKGVRRGLGGTITENGWKRVKPCGEDSQLPSASNKGNEERLELAQWFIFID